MFQTVMTMLSFALAAVTARYSIHKYNIDSKRAKLLELLSKSGERSTTAALWQMSDHEIEDVYVFLFVYGGVKEGSPKKQIPSDLKLRLNIISQKYNIFT